MFNKHITPCTVVITFLLVRDTPLEAPASVKRVYWSTVSRLTRLFHALQTGCGGGLCSWNCFYIWHCVPNILLCSVLRNTVGLPHSTREPNWTDHRLFNSPDLCRFWVSALWTAARHGPLKLLTWTGSNWILPSQTVGMAASLRSFHVDLGRP